MNPARSLGPAVVIGNTGTEQIRSHLYIVQPKIEIVVPCSNVERIHGIFADPVTSVGKLIFANLPSHANLKKCLFSLFFLSFIFYLPTNVKKNVKNQPPIKRNIVFRCEVSPSLPSHHRTYFFISRSKKATPN